MSDISRLIGINALSVKADTVMSTKKSAIREYVLGHLMSMLFNLIFLPYRYHNWKITVPTGTENISHLVFELCFNNNL